MFDRVLRTHSIRPLFSAGQDKFRPHILKREDQVKNACDLKIQSCRLYNDKYMIGSTQITNAEICAFVVSLVFNLLIRKVLLIKRKGNKNCYKVSYFLRRWTISRVILLQSYIQLEREILRFHGYITAKLYIIRMRNFQDTFETRQQSFLSDFSICTTVPLKSTCHRYLPRACYVSC